MKHTIKYSAIAWAVSAVLFAAAAHAERGATLSVRNSGPASVPQVRSVQRDTANNEPVIAAANETVELLLADGTSLTLAPGARILVERYRYDHASHSGELRVKVETGTVRLVGGALNNSSEIAVAVAGGSVAIDNAVAFIDAGKDGSNITLVAGRKISIKGATETRVLDRANTTVNLNASGAFAGAPRKLAVSDLQRLSAQLNPGLVSGVVPNFVVDARSVDTSAAESAQPAGQTTEVAQTGGTEDDTAKDVKLTPVLSEPVTPAQPCAAGNCVAGAPNFDLGTSIGNVAARQTGRTLGANWLREYYAGDYLARLSGINAPAADYWPDGGFRTTTARIFGAAANSPYSVTLTGAPTPPDFITYIQSFECIAGSNSACHGTPIVNLYDAVKTLPVPPADQVPFGVTYRVAGTNGQIGDEIQLAFRLDQMIDTDNNFGYYSQMFRVPTDFSAPGVVQTASVNTPINQISQNDNGATPDFVITFGNDQASRDDELNDSAFRDTFRAVGDNAQFGLFSSYQLHFDAIDPAPGDPPDYGIRVWADGQSAYGVYAMQTGFHRTVVYPYASSLQPYCLVTIDNANNSACGDLARNLFGEFGGVPNITYDLDADGNLIPGSPVPGPGDPTNFIVSRDDDSFLVVDAISRLPGDSQRMFYATGTVSGDLGAGTAAQGATLDRFHLSAGLDPTATMGRAFLRPDTLLSLAPGALLSSDLLVLNAPYTSTVNGPSRALHYDFGASGDGAAQSSTISVTLGTLAYDPAGNRAQFSGRTVGSTARAGASRYSGSVESALFSTAAGGGNPNLAGTGRAGYLVLENYDQTSAPNGGTERTIENGAASTTNYALLRFGQVVAGGSAPAPARTSASGLTGYVGGIAEVISAAAATTVSVQPLLSSDLQLATDVAAGSVSATFSTQLGAPGTAATSVTLGGANRLSAFTGAKEYAAMTAAVPDFGAGLIADADAPNAAIVSGAPLVTNAAQGWTSDLSASTRTLMTGYRYLQWGFFFGDVAVAGGQQAHAHLTSWVAGIAANTTAPLPTGSADYTGHVLANVSNGDQLYSAAGSYANHWDFATRSGTGTMSFDNATYSLSTRLLGLRREGTTITSDSTTLFEGLIAGEGTRDYIGSLNGGFAASTGAATTDALAQHAALMGQFSLDTTRNGVAYRAVGTFGAERTGP